jgi:hypothetical protein
MLESLIVWGNDTVKAIILGQRSFTSAERTPEIMQLRVYVGQEACLPLPLGEWGKKRSLSKRLWFYYL